MEGPGHLGCELSPAPWLTLSGREVGPACGSQGPAGAVGGLSPASTLLGYDVTGKLWEQGFQDVLRVMAPGSADRC